MSKKESSEYLEKAINLMKYCHTPRTNEEIAKYLGYDDGDYIKHRSEISKYFGKEKTYEFLNTEFPFALIKTMDSNGKKRIAIDPNSIDDNKVDEIIRDVSTVNPIFLALNATEVYLLTSKLLDLVSDTGNSEIMNSYKAIVSKIVSQLSDYTQEMISKNYEEKSIIEHYDLDICEKRSFEPENNYGERIEDIAFYLKSGEEKKWELPDGTSIKGVLKEESGTLFIVLNSKRYDVEIHNNKITKVLKVSSLM